MFRTLSVLFAAVFAIAAVSAPANAMAARGGKAANCYSVKEAEAEQAIRIHSELMVIGLNCQHMTPPDQKNFYLQYREFTSTYADLFSGYENILIDYFKRTGSKNPIGSFNDMRTLFANKVSNDAARMRPDLFCRRYTPRIAKAAQMKREDLMRWASTVFPGHPVSKPVCGQ